ncbi:MAG: hypothetical protein NPIRA02_12960 [Nitrospirales bacterium]|nr:MAG: hypothetical protein NPIRA02_12960 [Nitrospirales bacterium]
MKLLHSQFSRFSIHGRQHLTAWITYSFVMIVSLLCIDPVLAKPRNVSSVEWQTDWIHPGATTTRSRDRQSLTTTLPNKNSIQDDYLSTFRIILGGGQNTVATITPMSYQNVISCPSLNANKGVVQGSCRAKKDGLKTFPKNTQVTLKITTPGNPARYLRWNIRPQRSSVIPRRPPASQIYVIGPAQMPHFIQEARWRDYKFRVTPQSNYVNPPGNQYGVQYKQIGGESFEKGQLIKFGDLIPYPAPHIQPMKPDTGLEISMFERDGSTLLKEGWTFLSVHYAGEPGENCQREILHEFPGTRRIWHKFSVRPFLLLTPGHTTCSKLWLQSIKLQGPKGKKPIDALLGESSIDG